MIYERVFPRWRPRPELRPTVRDAAGAALVLRWLGTAGFVVEAGGTTLLIDPFLSRPSLPRVARAPLVPDENGLRAHLPSRVDAILCSHGHYDHLLDAPRIARWTGAPLVGSASVCHVGRAEGLPEAQLVEVPPGGLRRRFGGIEVRFVPSLHGRILFGRVPHAGTLAAPPRLPVRWYEYLDGGVFGLLLEAGGTTVYHNGSADLIDAELRDVRADVALVGLAGRFATPRYLERLMGLLAPRAVVPTHHDAFFAPLGRGVHLLPGIDLDGFVSEVRRFAPAAVVVVPDFEEPIVVPAGDARGAALLDRGDPGFRT
ncbi:MAG: MBL fold metallo-hydrolase [Deltaproteobacteria bacterium]|nr:MBL fold metallo-hydrolase [Deltaproteobacteria bacterium]